MQTFETITEAVQNLRAANFQKFKGRPCYGQYSVSQEKIMFGVRDVIIAGGWTEDGYYAESKRREDEFFDAFELTLASFK